MSKLDPDDAHEQCTRIIELIEEVPEWKQERYSSFFESVIENVNGICETIDQTNNVTERQQNALNNFEAAVKNYLD